MAPRKRNLKKRATTLDSAAQAWLAGKPCGFFQFKSQQALQQLWDEFGDHEKMFWRSRYCLPLSLEKCEEYEDLWLNANSSFVTGQYTDEEKQALWDERGVGNRAIPRLAEALDAKRTDVARKALMAAVDTFEPAIALAKNQIVAYAGMAIAYAMIGKSAESHDWAKRGLVELAEMRAEMRRLHLSGDESPFIDRNVLDQMEKQLHICLEK